MKKCHFLVLTLITAVIFISPCRAQTKDQQPAVNTESQGKIDEVTDEMIDQFIKDLKNPKQEEELLKLREEDPEKLKEIILKEQSEKAPPRDRRARTRERLRQRQQQHIEWLQTNYPEEAELLIELQKKKPELFDEKISFNMRKYHRIKEAQEDNNTELADVLKQEIELNKKQYELIRQIHSTKKENKKEELIAELKDVLSQKYDIIVRKKQLAYEDLLKKLENLRNVIKESKENVKQWQDSEFKEKNIEARLKETLSPDAKFDWDQ